MNGLHRRGNAVFSFAQVVSNTFHIMSRPQGGRDPKADLRMRRSRINIFGADKLNLKIIDVPVRYRERYYGETNIQRWRHGVVLLGMVLFAAKKLKFV